MIQRSACPSWHADQAGPRPKWRRSSWPATPRRGTRSLTAKVVKFSEAADAWIKELRAEVRAGSRNERTVMDYEPVVERYLKPYFGDKAIDAIKASDIEGQAEWAARFDVLHQHCRAALEQHARDRWQTLERMNYGA